MEVLRSTQDAVGLKYRRPPVIQFQWPEIHWRLPDMLQKRKHHKECSYNLYIPLTWRLKTTCIAGLCWNIAMRWSTKITKFNKIGMEIFDSVSTRPEAFKRVLKTLRKGQRGILEKVVLRVYREVNVGKKPKLLKRNEDQRNIRKDREKRKCVALFTRASFKTLRNY